MEYPKKTMASEFEQQARNLQPVLLQNREDYRRKPILQGALKNDDRNEGVR